MEFDKSDKIFIKYMHDSRKYAPVLERLKLKLKDTTLSYKEYFETAFKYELLYSYKGILGAKCMLANSFNYTSFFERKFLETAAILFALKEGKLEDSNFKIFKIISQNRDIGEKEGNKFKKEFKIKTNKSFKDYCRENRYVFLRGLTVDDPNPIGLIKEIETHSFLEEQEKEQILESYRFNSCLIHYMVSSNNQKLFNSLIDERIQKDYKILKTYLKEELKNSAKLGPQIVEDEDFALIQEKYGLDFAMQGLDLIHAITNEQLNEVFLDPLEYMIMTTMSFLTSFSKRDYSYTLALPKMFFEKMNIYFSLISLSNYREMKSRYLSYLYILEKKVQFADEDINENEEILDNIQKIYKEFKDLNITNLNYYDFKSAILRTPSYLIYSKSNNFTKLADKFIENLELQNDYLRRIYKFSVIYSHSYGDSILIDEGEFRSVSFNVFGVILQTIHSYLLLLEDNLVIKLQSNASEIEDAITRFGATVEYINNFVASIVRIEQSDQQELDQLLEN